MNNKPATQIAVIAVFLQIAMQLIFQYIGTNLFGFNEYLRYFLSGLSILTYLLVLAFLLSVLRYYNEKNSIAIAFGVYIIFTTINNTVNLTIGYWMANPVTYYTISSIVHFFMVLYVAIMAFMVKHPVIRKGFALFAILSLVATIAVMFLPMLFGLLNIGFKAYRYIYLISILPLIAAIIIFNKTGEDTKSPDFLSDKPLFKNDPF
ncbi:MAG: hypothetical protein AAGC65_23625 [Mucilaginibacter sp.]|uniref:hypothetical protein n=1 Tax=Mucilaginibacter sp. TaxID=1882438 RepID=UPI0031A2C3A5